MLEIQIIEVSVTQMGFALMLKPPNREEVVPVFIGPLETYSISNALENQKLERPLTHDLMKESFDCIGYKVAKVVIDDFQSGTFFAKLYINNGKDEDYIIDSRPSDAIAMAIRFRSPIFMAESVYNQTAININRMKEKINQTDNKDETDSTFDEITDAFEAGLAGEEEEEKKSFDILQGLINDFPKPHDERQTKVHSTSKTGKKDYQSKQDVLQQMLRSAVQRERYEEAAKIRDEIN